MRPFAELATAVIAEIADADHQAREREAVAQYEADWAALQALPSATPEGADPAALGVVRRLTDQLDWWANVVPAIPPGAIADERAAVRIETIRVLVPEQGTLPGTEETPAG